MSKKLQILLASRSKERIQAVAAGLVERSDFKIGVRLIDNGHADPLHGLTDMPDVVVMILDNSGNSDLEHLVQEQKPGRPPMIVVAELGDAQTMRLAMLAGARDFLSGAVKPADLVESIDRIGAQIKAANPVSETEGNLTIFVNAKGGSGATFLACNTAHILKSVSDMSTALLSLDLQFEGMAQYFDTKLKHGLMEVLDCVETLDDVALDAYMTQHKSGLKLLAAEPQDVIQCHSDRAGQFDVLIRKMLGRYDHVIVDMPRRIDPYVVPVLEKASRIVLVVQQTLGHIQDATRMLDIFSAYGVPAAQVLVVINRFTANAPINGDDIKRALRGTEVFLMPSDFRTVAESINLGIPIHEHARNSSVTKALLSLESRLTGRVVEDSDGLFRKAFSNILRKDA